MTSPNDIRIVLRKHEANSAITGIVWYSNGCPLREVIIQVKDENGWHDVPLIKEGSSS